VRYTVELQRGAERQFDRLSAELKRSVLRALRSLEQDPRRPGARPVRSMPGSLRMRAGDYRIIYEVDDARRLVLVSRIARRDKAYRD
jgi:mRNA interferase RelE/StbE